MSDELALRPEAPLTPAQSFELLQRRAKAVGAGSFLPKAFENNIANCMFALEVSDQLGISWLEVMQNLHFVHGRVGWASPFIIGRINKSGKFAHDLRFEEGGEGDERFCIAWATDKDGVKLKGDRITIAMAKAEGWWSRSGSKWPTMTGQMLRYRAATFFYRTYAFELLMGIRPADELQDMQPARAKIVFGRGNAAPDSVVTDGLGDFFKCDGNHRGPPCEDSECWLKHHE